MLDFFKRFQNADPRVKKLLAYLGYLTAFIFLIGMAWLTTITGVSQENKELDTIYPNTTMLIIQTVSKLVLLLALMFMFFTVLRKWQSRRMGQTQKRLTIIETIRLSQRQAVHLIRVDSRQFLIGATDQSMSLISEVEQPEQVVVENCEDKNNAGSFNSYLRSLLDPGTPSTGNSERRGN